jgi:ABC-type transport system substrate-binding protein
VSEIGVWEFYESLSDERQGDLTTEQRAVVSICDLRQEVNSGDGFCDPRLDRLARNARTITASDPSTASVLWTEIYPAVNDASPVIPLARPPWQIMVSPWVGNTAIGRLRGPLFDQMWVR